MRQIEDRLAQWGVKDAMRQVALKRGMPGSAFASFYQRFVRTYYGQRNRAGLLIFDDIDRAHQWAWFFLRDNGYPRQQQRPKRLPEAQAFDPNQKIIAFPRLVRQKRGMQTHNAEASGKITNGTGKVRKYAAATDAQLELAVAQSIYETHLVKGKAPAWRDASDNVREWVLAQARSAIKAVRKANRLAA